MDLLLTHIHLDSQIFKDARNDTEVRIINISNAKIRLGHSCKANERTYLNHIRLYPMRASMKAINTSNNQLI